MPHQTRLVVTQIEDYAQNDPSRVWAHIPVSDDDLSKGFKDVTYADFHNAVGHACAWLEKTLPPARTPFETIAYAGVKDVRYPILAVAAAHIGRKLLLLSPFASIEAQAHLIQASECKVFLHGEHNAAMVAQVLAKAESTQCSELVILSLSDLLFKEQIVRFQFKKSPDEAKEDPWLVFHTSGTTGLPKLITYTHVMMASFNEAELMPDAKEENMLHHFANRRWYTPLPSLHFVGMTVSLQFPIFTGGSVVIGPGSTGPTTPALALETMTRGKVQGSVLPPVLIDALCASPEGLACLRAHDYVYFAGAPLSRDTAAKLLPHVPVKPAMGSTEAGAYFLRITGDEDWEWYSFRPGMGMQFQPTSSGDLYEAVFVREKGLEAWQQVFQVYPELHEFRTKDLFVRHPSRPDAWKYVGRADDLVVFSHGEDLYATGVEEEIVKAHKEISGVLVGGQGRAKPFVIVEWNNEKTDDERLAELVPILEKANEKCSDLVKLSKELVLFTRPEKRLVRTGKGSVSRIGNEERFRDEIDALYVAWR